MGHSGGSSGLEGSLDSWWSVELQPWWRDIDYLGHVTAASYAAIYEQAFGEFVTERWVDPEPSYVVASLNIEYLHEIRLIHCPITVHIRIDHVGASSMEATMVITDNEGKRRSTAKCGYVRWNREQRKPQLLSEAEQESLRHR